MVATYLDDELPSDRLPRRDIDVAHLGRRISAKRWWLIGPTLACFLVSAVVVNVVPPRYTGDTKLLLESQESYFTRPDRADAQAAPLPDDEAVQSQVQLVSSRDLARAAIRKLDLQGNPEFDPLAGGIGPITRTLILLGLEQDPMRIPPEERMLENFSDRLTVFPVNKSRVLTVEFESKDPDLAARAANTVADLYIDLQASAKRESARNAADTLNTLLGGLRAKAAEAEAKAQAFRTQSGLVLGPNNSTITAQQLADMSTQMAQARSAEAEAQAKAKLIRDMTKNGRTADIADVVNNDLIRRLSEQRANTQGEIALQSRTLLPGHPRMQELNAQLSDLDRQIRAAGDKAARGLDNDARIAASRVDNLTTAMNTQKDVIGAAGGDQVKLNELDLNARLLKDQLELNTTKYQDAMARENAVSTPADARVISRAVAPQQPSFPKKLPIIAIATIAGALISLGIMLARELLSGRAFAPSAETNELPIAVRAVRHDDLDEAAAAFAAHEPLVVSPAPQVSPAIVEEHPAPAPTLETPMVSVPEKEPALEPTAVEPEMPPAHLLSHFGSEDVSFSATFDAVLARKKVDQALRILVCSTEAAQSPAPLAMKLGRALARSSRVIAIDCFEGDELASRPSIQSLAGHDYRAMSGFRDLAEGHASFAEVIHRDVASRLHFIAGVLTEAQRSRDEDGVAILLDALAETYDYVVACGPAPGIALPTLLPEHCDLLVIDDAAGPADLERMRSLYGSPAQGGLEVLVVTEPERAGAAVAGSVAA